MESFGPSCSPSPPASPIGRHRSMSENLADDLNIQATNDDASLSKRSAVQLGYWSDPFISLFLSAQPAFHPGSDRKPPEINRGYWARVAGVRMLVDQFLKVTKPSKSPVQFVSIGAGFDSLWWRLVGDGAGHTVTNYTEVDFPGVTTKKIHAILRHKQDLLVSVAKDGNHPPEDVHHIDLHGDRYHLVGADLRSSKEVRQKLQESGMDFSLPTLVLSECVLVYMTADQSTKLLTTLALLFHNAVFVNYEQVNLDDKFGQVMQDNLYYRGLSLTGVEACLSLDAQKSRFLESGWLEAKAWDMNGVYASLPEKEIKRIEAIEFLDENELLTQLLNHYCISIGFKDTKGFGLNAIGFSGTSD